jgi:hypothetical protein
LFVVRRRLGEALGEVVEVGRREGEDEAGGEATQAVLGGSGEAEARPQAGDLEAGAGGREGAAEVLGEEALEDGGVEGDVDRGGLAGGPFAVCRSRAGRGSAGTGPKGTARRRRP